MGGVNVKNTMLDKVLEFVAPHLCSGCGKTGSPLCDNCKYDIITETFSGCVVCLKHERNGICQDHEAGYAQAWVVGLRKGALQRLIGGFKFQNMKAAALSLAQLLDQRLPALPDDTLLVPIPTATSHIRERGYDHMLLIAKYLSRIRGLPLAPLIGRSHNLTQHHSSRQARITQARSAFRLVGAVRPDKTYLLLDDVVTTGSTLAEASRLLVGAGASRVWVGAIARQPLD